MITVYTKQKATKLSQWVQLVLLGVLLSISSQTFAQTQTITGKVTAKSGEGIPGVNIYVKGNTGIGTSSTNDGSFKLANVPQGAILVFSFIGYTPQEIKVGNQTNLSVALAEDDESLNQVVVVGYGTQKRSEITGSVSTIDSKEITSTPVLRVEQALQGRASGVQVTQNSGAPGSGLNVRIRGIGTVNNSDPLYVVDGMPVEGMDFLNPGDIESISVLKDAASAAIYGSRAANGVVLITTKKGKNNQKLTTSYQMYYGVQNRIRKLDLLNATEYATLSNVARNADPNVTPFPEFANPAALGEGTDWQDAIFERNAPIQNHQVSLTGGNKRSVYSLSTNFFQQDGIIGRDKSRFNRFSFRFNSSHKINKKISVGNTLSLIHFKKKNLAENDEFGSPLMRAINMDPVTPVKNADGTYAASQYAQTDIKNPVNQIALANDTWTSNRLLGSVFGTYEIIEGLKFRSSFGLDVTYGTSDVFFPAYDLGMPHERLDVNSVVKGINLWSNWIFENNLSYDKTFGKHGLNLVVGMSAQEFNYRNLTGVRNNLATNNPDQAFLSASQDGENQIATGNASESALASYYGRVNYSFAGKYLVSATVRVDGSSRFGANNRYATFPSFSLGWVVSEEGFMKGQNFINFLKLRASWGQNGNQQISNYGFTSSIANGLNYTLGSGELLNNGAAPVVASNPDLKWETSTQTDLGLDLGFLQDRIMFSVDYYKKTTQDMLVVVPIPLHVGAGAPFVNAGSVDNSGVELMLEYRKKEGDFKYNVGFNMAFMRNEVTSLGNGDTPVSAGSYGTGGGLITRTEVGQPIASFYGWQTDGIFQTQSEVDAHAFQSAETAAGDFRYKDLNGDGVINDDDRTFIGNPTPNFTYGITAGASYKNFDLSMFWQGVQGNDIFNAVIRYDFNTTNRLASRRGYWNGAGTSNTEPRLSIGDPNQNSRISDRFVEDGSYLRLKNIQLGYTFPEALLKKAKISKVRVYISAQNLVTFTKYKGLDPEIGVGRTGLLDLGIDRGFYPQARTFLTGVNITF
jgi:TonB-linked SusC/RagA family outer membrane protein